MANFGSESSRFAKSVSILALAESGASYFLSSFFIVVSTFNYFEASDFNFLSFSDIF